MTMETEITPIQKPKRKAKRRHAEPKAPKLAPIPSEFAGMTEKDCCTACKLECCVITGVAICGHPFKGGLQPALQNKPEVIARFERAKKAMAHRMIDLRGM